MAARARGLDQPTGGVQPGVAGQDGELHRSGIGRQARSIAWQRCVWMMLPGPRAAALPSSLRAWQHRWTGACRFAQRGDAGHLDGRPTEGVLVDLPDQPRRLRATGTPECSNRFDLFGRADAGRKKDPVQPCDNVIPAFHAHVST